MIFRENYRLVRAHMAYRRKVIQNDEGTIATYWQSLKHLLQWADAKSFQNAQKIMPAFPEYLLSARNDGKEKNLSPKYMGKALSHARAFFEWLRLYERGYNTITEAWIKTLQVRRSAGTQSRLHERSYWKLEDIQKIIALQPSCLRHRRDIAALAFLFLSGARIGAFVTLPDNCIDIELRRVMQLPERGVQTKNSKAAITSLLPLSDLLEVVLAWDKYIRSQAGNGYNWYAPLDHFGETVKAGLLDGKYTGRTEAFKKGLMELCELANVPYKSPHKIRHGFGVYGVKNAKDIGQMKAISQNLMHANMGITDGIYGRLAEDDLSEIMSNFGT